MFGLVTFMVDTAAALAKYITEQERGKGGDLTSCSRPGLAYSKTFTIYGISCRVKMLLPSCFWDVGH